MEEVVLVNPGGNPFTGELIRRTWQIFKDMGGTSPAKDPELWREAFERARAELGAAAFKGWYENPIWVRGYTRHFRGKTIHVSPYPRLTPREIRGLTGGVPVYRLRVTDPEAYKEYLRRRNAILEEFVRMYPSPAEWERAGRPRAEQLLFTVHNPEAELLLNPGNPFAKGFIKEVWAEFKAMGGRSPALDPDLWRRAFEKVRAEWGARAFTGWYNPEVFVNPDFGFGDFRERFIPYLAGYDVMDIIKMTAAAIGGFWFANYLPKVTKWETGWQGVIASLIGALIAGYIGHAVARVGLPAFIGGMLNVGAKALKLATGGKVVVISGIEDIEDIGDIGEEEFEEEEFPEELLGEEEEEEIPEELFGEEEIPEELLGEEAKVEEKPVKELIL
jgi:hypothetical protein